MAYILILDICLPAVIFHGGRSQGAPGVSFITALISFEMDTLVRALKEQKQYSVHARAHAYV